ncbi:DNA helicase/exodeoxyribonuclease V gamma subunit [Volucribacter psittacicida]|uniref:RecBCD enzyme subunit RecC n=1 Tax=Volucribacter psittacicida TaxID=203482 RepID=A0A4R1FVY7_9PAST|nr:exodeoxyribonuclease V subunit gamma [Volucribacter psittacicida]TCJ97949.1 DNA helicase/exodeoxyribonuclease V gamma subunit [Volucribacter psittacicida]
MFTVYHSNQLEMQKEMLLKLMEMDPLSDPFQAETILVQSPGMAQWLQLQIADKLGIAANFHFPMPASFIWQQYCETLPNVSEQTAFSKEAMTWRLMTLLTQSDFAPLRQYFHFNGQRDQQKCYQLAHQIANLFDQYLVYRPEWILAWEQGNDQLVQQAIADQQRESIEQIIPHIHWQAELWRALIADIRRQNVQILHRANLHQYYLDYLAKHRPHSLPKRLFIFGISALPQSYLVTFQAMSQHCHIHLFFNNPCRYYWGDIIDPHYLQRLKLRSRQIYQQQQTSPLFSSSQQALLEQLQTAPHLNDEQHLVGNPLLASWGKLGRDFLYALTELENNEISAFVDPVGANEQNAGLLAQIQHRILNLDYQTPLTYQETDRSLIVQSCHSPMREVEVLHDHLLDLFEQDPNLTPKDIVVMMADIDHYAPYINAVFGQYRQDKRFIPFSLSDGRLTENDVLVAGFLKFLQMKESRFSAEQLLELLDIPAIRKKFEIEQEELAKLRYWVEQTGIRFGLTAQMEQSQYNSWQKGLERMLLGYAMREQDGIWQDSLGFNPSYGLKGEFVGQLAAFVERITQWHQYLMQAHHITDWCEQLSQLIKDFFAEEDNNRETLFYLQQTLTQFNQQLEDIQYQTPIYIEVIAEVLTEKLHNSQNSLRFLTGKVSFCTLLPMRSIPFKVICLLGMNDADYPRQQPRNSFDLMQYHQQKGDRLRREDDRYLFLEALLSAQQQFYLSYVGRSIIDNQRKEPSVLVNQLLDYLAENMPLKENIRDLLVIEQPMQLFNPKNTEKNDRTFTFATQWKPLSQSSNYQLTEFIQPLPQYHDVNAQVVIELPQLIAFVKNPVKFFFEQGLGVYFKQLPETIDENENFVLNNLNLYQINQALLTQTPQQREQYFAQLRVKGILPRANFGQIYAEKMEQQVSQFQQQIQDYLNQPAQQQFIALSFDNVKLEGNINQLYGEQKKRVAWRLGNIRDEDIIENWLYYLALQASTEEVITPAMFYGKQSQPESCPPMNQQQAIEQLQVYIRDYLASAQQLQLVPTKKIKEYLKLINDPNLTEEQVYYQHFNEIARSDNYGYQTEDPYWLRLLSQTTSLDLNKINQQFLTWFSYLLRE